MNGIKANMYFVIILNFLALSFTFNACHHQSSGNHEHSRDASTESHQGEHDQYAHWAYSGEEGPDQWSHLCPAYATCDGKRQSPIDLKSSLSTDSDVKVERAYHSVSGVEFVNNGHSIQVNFTGDNNEFITINGSAFELKQFHFHCPSEHTLDGVAFAGEAHFVHVSADGEISVLGVFMKEGAENELLNEILPFIPKKAGEKTRVIEEVKPGCVFSDDDTYYIYEGSLTTPPCTEGVNWFVRKRCIEVSKEQLAALKEVMPAHNARPVQPTNDREFGHLDEKEDLACK